MAVLDVHITGKFNANPDSVPLSKGRGDTLKWHNDTNEGVVVNFNNGTPFPADRNPYHIPAGRQVESGSIRVNADTKWAYTIGPETGGAGTDPWVIIDK